jgi:hypothetical protein
MNMRFTTPIVSSILLSYFFSGAQVYIDLKEYTRAVEDC